MAGYWPSSFLRIFYYTQKRMRPISSYLDRASLINKGFIIYDKTPKHDKFSLRDKARIPSGQDSSILPARVANHSARLGSSCPLTELVIHIIMVNIPRDDIGQWKRENFYNHQLFVCI